MSKKGNSAKSCNFRAVIAFSGQRSFQLSGEGVRVNCFFGSKVISIVRRGGAGELLFRSKVIAQLSGEGVRVNCFSGQRSKVAGKCWIVSTLNCIMKEHSRTFRKVKKWRENAGLFVSVLIVEWLFRCTVSSKSKPIKEAGFRKKLSFGKYSPRV